MSTIDTTKLSAQERAKLLAELQQQERIEQDKARAERETYDNLKDERVKEIIDMLITLSDDISLAKAFVFNSFEDILALKKQVFKITDEKMDIQQSHTFTSKDGTVSIILGHNVVDRWDETVDVGVSRVKEWLRKLAKDDESATLVGMITDLLKPNKDGVLKAARVLDLSKKAVEIGDPELIEAVALIRESYRPSKTSQFVKAKIKNLKNEDVWIPLSMSGV